MAEDHTSITKLCELLEQVKSQIKIVESELAVHNHRDDYSYQRELAAKSDKIELVKTSLEALLLKTPKNAERDSGYNSACPDRRNAVFLTDGDFPEPVACAERNSLDVDDSLVNPRARPERHCLACQQQIRTPMQVTEETDSTSPASRSTENDDCKEF